MAKINTFKKFFITFSLAFLICFTVIIAIVSVLINNYLSKDKFESLSASSAVIGRFIEEKYETELFDVNFKNVVRAMSGVNDNIVIIVSKDGKISSCSCSDYSLDSSCIHSKNTIDTSFLEKVDKRFNEIGKLNNTYRVMHYTAGKVIYDRERNVLGYVFASSPASDLTEFYKDLFKLYIFGAVIPIIVLFFALYILTYRWTKPLKLMSEASKAMAKGDFSKRIPVLSNDEIGQLSESFNTMTNSLVELENMRRSFIANVSHELKTPMTTIGGFIDGILDNTIPKDKEEYYLGVVSAEIKRLSRLVQSMLNLSKLESDEFELKPTNFDLKELILDVVFNQEQRIVSKGINILGLEQIEKNMIYADKDLIHQVIYNLCDNAVKFTNESGFIEFDLANTQNSVKFVIKNSGAGIPEAELPLIFDRFYKSDSSRSENKDSTGLGLYIVKTIVKIHGGSVFVKSDKNSFTEFGVVLPIKYGGKL